MVLLLLKKIYKIVFFLFFLFCAANYFLQVAYNFFSENFGPYPVDQRVCRNSYAGTDQRYDNIKYR